MTESENELITFLKGIDEYSTKAVIVELNKDWVFGDFTGENHKIATNEHNYNNEGIWYSSFLFHVPCIGELDSEEGNEKLFLTSEYKCKVCNKKAPKKVISKNEIMIAALKIKGV